MEDIWRPACDLKQLHLRAQMLSKIRDFFDRRSVLEVETPLLCQATGTDPQLDFFSTEYHRSPKNRTMYLQTSPEFAMKRLLAAGSGSIFQICKAFRNAEFGRYHNPEFSILEWYRIDFTLWQLIDEVIELLTELLTGYYVAESVKKMGYFEVFKEVTGLNPLEFCQESYALYASQNSIMDAIKICGNDHSMWLDFIFSYKIQPSLKNLGICIVFGYPAIQSSLARVNIDNPLISDRFEVFIEGIEIGNGFFELSNAEEQEKRFNQENKTRELKGLVAVESDKLFLDALKFGLPDCSGIALGLDRLLMVMANTQALSDVITFPLDRA
ncbi:MAG: EF-P lysine aminoacylase GenX [Methylococcales bacterium]|nr:EF-P lysine aminoacylase GenX [Methylococcales bacterium]